MSYNLVDPVTGDLTRVAGNSNIVDTAIETTSTWSSSKIYSAINSIGFKGDAPENANSATTPGVYFINRNDDAYPVRQGYLIVSKPRQDYNCILQEVYNFNANIIYSRGCWFNSWYDWQQVATMDKVNALHKQTVGYIEGSLLSSAIESANLYYQKFGDNKLVINGWVTLGSAVPTQGTKIFTLPNGWKANSNYLLPCYTPDSNSAYACMIDISTSDVKSYTPLPSGVELRFCADIYLA